MNNYSQSLTRNQQGGGFIELLVALVILAVGLLGVLSMQARGLSSNQRALFATDASLIVYDVADRILAYNDLTPTVLDEYVINITSATVACNLNCTTSEDDIAGWIQAVSGSNLPSARLRITYTAPVYMINLAWDGERSGNAIAADFDCGDTSISCFSLQVQP